MSIEELEKELAEERRKYSDFKRTKELKSEIRKLRTERQGDIFGGFLKGMSGIHEGMERQKSFYGQSPFGNPFGYEQPRRHKKRK